MTPLAVSIVGRDRLGPARSLVVLELIRSGGCASATRCSGCATGVVLLVLSLWRGGPEHDRRLGRRRRRYPPAVLFAVAALFILLVLLHYSTVISKLVDQNTILAQRLALLEQRLREGRD